MRALPLLLIASQAFGQVPVMQPAWDAENAYVECLADYALPKYQWDATPEQLADSAGTMCERQATEAMLAWAKAMADTKPSAKQIVDQRARIVEDGRKNIVRLILEARNTAAR